MGAALGFVIGQPLAGGAASAGAVRAPYKDAAAKSTPQHSCKPLLEPSMRIVFTLVALSLLGGCSLWMPRHDPSQAWIELDPAADMQALAVDGRELDDGRYFQISPGSHTLDVRYRFEVSGADVGRGSPPLERDCRVRVQYDRFAAGSRYRLAGGAYGFRPTVKLQDVHRYELTRAEEQGCGNFAER
jgi:hypothetical protein